MEAAMGNKLQNLLVQLLREIDDICRKNDIRYYLWGGTCLGQLRHGGFIPWDDDIDIVMPRKDYEKFEAVIGECMPEGRDLVSFGRYPTYTNPIPRYMDLNTTALRSGRLGDGTVCGECIEIFILDPMPKDAEKQDEWKKLLYVYTEILCTGWIQGKRRWKKEYVDIELYNKYRKKMEQAGKEDRQAGRIAVLKELESELFCIDEEDSDVYCLRWMPRSLYQIPIYCFGKPKEVIYEGLNMLGPERPAEMLQLYIGHSWRNLLPPEARGEHPTRINHDLAAGNLEREYLQIMGTEEMAEALQTTKDESMEYYRLRNQYYLDRVDPSLRYAVARSRAEARKYGKDALRADNKLALRALGEFIRLQRLANIRDNSIPVPLDDDLVDIAAKAMFEEAQIQQLFEILHVRHKNEDASRNKSDGIHMTNTQRDYYRACKDFLKMAVHLDEGEYDDAEAICENYMNKYPDHRWLYRCRMRLALQKKAYEEMISLGEEALSLYPGDDCISKRYADALLALGRKEEAEEIYRKVSRESINGLILREMKEYGIEEAALKLDAKVWKFD